MTILNIVVPPFRPAGEWFDSRRNVHGSGHTGPGARPDRGTGMRSSKLTLDRVTPW
jgi:hypothetical protein